MFSASEKQNIAKIIEDFLLGLNHPEMPKEKPKFKLHVEGAEKWSWADIEPNWKYDDKPPNVNLFNEISRQIAD